MRVDAKHFGVHEERASLDWLDEGVLAKILIAFLAVASVSGTLSSYICDSTTAQLSELFED